MNWRFWRKRVIPRFKPNPYTVETMDELLKFSYKLNPEDAVALIKWAIHNLGEDKIIQTKEFTAWSKKYKDVIL